MMRRRLVLSLVMIGLAWAPAAARTPTDELRGTIAEVNRILADPATEGRPQERVSAILDVVDPRFAFQEVAEVALGQPWGRLTPAAQAEFVGLFADLFERAFVMALASKVRPAEGLDVRYQSESVNGGEATVLTTVAGRRGDDLPVSYRMVRRGDQWLIADVVLDGVSFVDNYRAQFERVIRQSSWEDLIARLQARRLDTPEWWPDPGTPRKRQMTASVIAPSDSPRVAATQGPVGNSPAVVPVAPPSRPEAVRPAAQTPTPIPTPTPAPGETRESTTPPAPPRSVASLAPVALVPPSPPRQERITYWVQAGAFRDLERVTRLESSLLALKLPVVMRPTEVSTGSGRVRLMRVQVGPFANEAAALGVQVDLRKRGHATFVTVERQ